VNIGAIVGKGHFSRVEVNSNQSAIREVVGQGGFPVGGELEYQRDLGQTGLSLGVGLSGWIREGKLTMEADPSGGYESGRASFSPVVFSVSLGYRLPMRR